MTLAMQIFAALIGLGLFAFGIKAMLVSNDYGGGGDGGFGILAIGFVAMVIGFLMILGAIVWWIFG